MHNWQLFIIGVLATTGFVKLCEIAYDRYKQNKAQDTSLVIREQNELSDVRQYFALLSKELTAINDKLKNENADFKTKIALLQRDIRDKDREIDERDEEIKKLTGERDALKARVVHFDRLETLPVRED
jgi:SMC interacting uncharacterized protein involved in chromosome segregation